MALLIKPYNHILLLWPAARKPEPMQNKVFREYRPAKLDKQMALEGQRLIQKYPTNYFIYQHRDLYCKDDKLTRTKKKFLCQNPLETLKSQKRGALELYFDVIIKIT